MKRNFNRLCLSVCVCILTGTVSAQQTMMMGNVTDMGGNPIKGAAVCLKSRQFKAATISDISGLFASDLLPRGHYTITIISGGKELKAGSIFLEANTTPQKYYHLTINEKNKAMVVATTDNPFMEAKLGDIAKNDLRYDLPRNRGRIYFLDTKDTIKIDHIRSDTKSAK